MLHTKLCAATVNCQMRNMVMQHAALKSGRHVAIDSKNVNVPKAQHTKNKDTYILFTACRYRRAHALENKREPNHAEKAETLGEIGVNCL